MSPSTGTVRFGPACNAWYDALGPVWQSDDVAKLQTFLADEATQFDVVPAREHIFAAFDAVAPNDVRVVLLGQDPYPTPGHAHGFAFSYRGSGSLPRSLNNVRREIERDLHITLPDGAGDLTPWAEQGVLLLNTVLTTRAGEAGAHRRRGWETLTRAVLDVLNERTDPIVYLLWGGDARKHRKFIAPHHIVLEAGHPSPLSIKHFRECAHFSRANAHLAPNPVDWARIAPSQP